jgi:hypothetical protein
MSVPLEQAVTEVTMSTSANLARGSNGLWTMMDLSRKSVARATPAFKSV